MRGFLPASLVDIRRVPNLDEYLGQTIQTKVIELNRSRNNVVLSRRAVLEEERKEQRQAILERLQPGLIIEGQISNIVDFGAFVDLDGIDGLIHISELSWSHVNHPSEVLSIGQTVEVKVLDIDRDRQRISLGLKQTQEDPWQRVVDTYHVGDELEGAVTKVVAFGAFVEILEGVEGLVHISELAQQHVENPREIVAAGRRGEGQDPRDRLRAPPSLALDQAGRGPGPAAPHRLTDDAGDLEDMPELGLSEDVFAEAPGRREVDDGIDAATRPPLRPAPPRPTLRPSARRPRPPRPRSRTRSRSRRRPRPRTRSPATSRRRKRPPPKTSDRAAVRRTDGRHRRGQVGGTGRAESSRRGHDLLRPGRSRPLRGPRSASTWSSSAGVLTVAPEGRVDRSAVARFAFASDEERGWLEQLLWPRVGRAGRASGGRAQSALEPPPVALVVETPLLFEAGLERNYDATIAVVADEAVRAERAGARGHAALDERTARQLPQAEKAARATYAVENSGSLRELGAGAVWGSCEAEV